MHLIFLSSPADIFFIAFGETERERGREREKHGCEREASISCLSHVPGPGLHDPDQGSNPRPTYVPWWGIKRATSGHASDTPTGRATPARAQRVSFMSVAPSRVMNPPPWRRSLPFSHMVAMLPQGSVKLLPCHSERVQLFHFIEAPKPLMLLLLQHIVVIVLFYYLSLLISYCASLIHY